MAASRLIEDFRDLTHKTFAFVQSTPAATPYPAILLMGF